MDTSDVWDVDLVNICHDIAARFPIEARPYLAAIKVRLDASLKTHADAGRADIRIKPRLFCSSKALAGIVVHEICHVLLKHYDRCAAGTLSRGATEIEADAAARRLGFEPELRSRALFYGR
jgi:hypothetical protein